MYLLGGYLTLRRCKEAWHHVRELFDMPGNIRMVRNRFQPGEAFQIVELVKVLIFAKLEACSNADKLMLQD